MEALRWDAPPEPVGVSVLRAQVRSVALGWTQDTSFADASQRKLSEAEAIEATLPRPLVRAMAELRSFLVEQAPLAHPADARAWVTVCLHGEDAEFLAPTAQDALQMFGTYAALLLHSIQRTRSHSQANDAGEVSAAEPGKVWHELGHLFESFLRGGTEAALAWRQSRAPERKELLIGVGRFLRQALSGRFYAPYVGVLTADQVNRHGERYEPTEVTSMGLEMFHSPETMAELFLRDREHFYLALAVILCVRDLPHPGALP